MSDRASLRQVKQLLEVLTDATVEDLQQFIKAGDLLKLMMGADLSKVDREAFRQLLVGMETLRNDLLCGYYNPAEVQLEQFREWNGKFGLGFSEEDIAVAGASQPFHQWSRSRPLTLTWTLDTLAGTCKAKADILASVVKVCYTNPILFEKGRARLAQLRTEDAVQPVFTQRQLEWTVTDLAANWRLAPDACLDQRLAGVELLDIGTQHPEALKAQDSTKMPHWNLGAVQVDFDGDGSFRGAPFVSWHRGNQGAVVGVHGAGNANPDWSVPVREL